jgi:hypothetical protein
LLSVRAAQPSSLLTTQFGSAVFAELEFDAICQRTAPWERGLSVGLPSRSNLAEWAADFSSYFWPAGEAKKQAVSFNQAEGFVLDAGVHNLPRTRLRTNAMRVAKSDRGFTPIPSPSPGGKKGARKVPEECCRFPSANILLPSPCRRGAGDEALRRGSDFASSVVGSENQCTCGPNCRKSVSDVFSFMWTINES